MLVPGVWTVDVMMDVVVVSAERDVPKLLVMHLAEKLWEVMKHKSANARTVAEADRLLVYALEDLTRRGSVRRDADGWVWDGEAAVFCAGDLN